METMEKSLANSTRLVDVRTVRGITVEHVRCKVCKEALMRDHEGPKSREAGIKGRGKKLDGERWLPNLMELLFRRWRFFDKNF